MCEELNSNGHSHIEKKNNRAFYRTRGFKINREREHHDASADEFLDIEPILTISLQQATQHYSSKVSLLSLKKKQSRW